MAIFSPQNNAPAKKDQPSFASDAPPATPPRETPAVADFNPSQVAPPRPAVQADTSAKESLIAADLTIEGKIEGSGHVRIAGKFKGDVNVQGNLRIENGAKLTGGVKAKQVVVAGELDGNIESAARVELMDSAILTGDVKAGSLTVAAGSKIRGHVECGWDASETVAPRKNGKAEATELREVAS
ncbi:bactofilin family protein [Luteimonas saliphila]|uniref:bactofilin family protein n=1 Tax=Luteimonas saliphila TaxID=2804919 RepID=UPI00192DE46D|nr:polymer-forming cytoskeletal protein [Luteimonas saliphila]